MNITDGGTDVIRAPEIAAGRTWGGRGAGFGAVRPCW